MRIYSTQTSPSPLIEPQRLDGCRVCRSPLYKISCEPKEADCTRATRQTPNSR